MQRIAVRYSRYRHRSLRTGGHLFERRYKAKLVDVDKYFLALVRYIHRNPVKARIVSDPTDYRWSSHQAYLGHVILPWLTTDFALSLFAADLDRARIAYRRFMSECRDDDFDVEAESHPQDSRILGSDRFIESLPFVPFKPRSALTLEQLAEQICAHAQVTSTQFRSLSRARSLTPLRVQFAQQAIDLRIATLSDVVKTSPSSRQLISRISRRC
jgi:hypothetical protein